MKHKDMSKPYLVVSKPDDGRDSSESMKFFDDRQAASNYAYECNMEGLLANVYLLLEGDWSGVRSTE